MRRVLLFLLAPMCLLAAGPINFGLKAGVALNDLQVDENTTAGSFFSGTKRWTVGPTVDINLPFNFAIEADLFFRRYGSGYLAAANAVTLGLLSSRATANTFEFPVLLKYRIGEGTVRPYVEAGVAFRTLTGFDEIRNFATDFTSPAIPSLEPDDSMQRAFVVGGGLELRLGVARITPELRFTRWGVNNLRQGFATINQTSRNQAEVLLGITF